MHRDILKEKADRFAHRAYALARMLPKEELFGLSSQLRRASLSVPLNIIEGYARQSAKSERQFLIISFGSLKECMYLVDFATEEGFITENDTVEIRELGDELGKLLWAKAKTLASKSS